MKVNYFLCNSCTTYIARAWFSFPLILEFFFLQTKAGIGRKQTSSSSTRTQLEDPVSWKPLLDSRFKQSISNFEFEFGGKVTCRTRLLKKLSDLIAFIFYHFTVDWHLYIGISAFTLISNWRKVPRIRRKQQQFIKVLP